MAHPPRGSALDVVDEPGHSQTRGDKDDEALIVGPGCQQGGAVADGNIVYDPAVVSQFPGDMVLDAGEVPFPGDDPVGRRPQ